MRIVLLTPDRLAHLFLGIRTTASIIHHNYATSGFTLSAVALHEKTVGDPVEVCSDYKKTANRGSALGCVAARSPTLHPGKYMLYAFQVTFSLSLSLCLCKLDIDWEEGNDVRLMQEGSQSSSSAKRELISFNYLNWSLLPREAWRVED